MTNKDYELRMEPAGRWCDVVVGGEVVMGGFRDADDAAQWVRAGGLNRR